MSHPIASVLGRLSLFLVPTSLVALAGCSRGYGLTPRAVVPSQDRFEYDVEGPCKNLQDAVNKTHEAAFYANARWGDMRESCYRVIVGPLCVQGKIAAAIAFDKCPTK